MAALVGHLPLASVCRFPLVGAAFQDSPTNCPIILLRRSRRHRSKDVIESLIEGNRYSRPGHLTAIRGQVARNYPENVVSQPTAFTAAINAVQVESLPKDLESRGAVENQHPFSHLEVGKRWKEIQGAEHWKGLLDPIDPVLRGEVIRYGEFAQATYDAFDNDTHSRFCGSCRYSKTRLLHKVGLENRGYEVTEFIYATSGGDNLVSKFFKTIERGDTDEKELDDVWDKESNWMGFVAVATDPNEIKRLGRRDVVVVWRGTVTKLEWVDNLHGYLTSAGLHPSAQGTRYLKVEAGFLSMYKAYNEDSPYTEQSARRQVLRAVKSLIQRFKDEELSITVVGHSLGSALAILSAYDIVESGDNQVPESSEVIDEWSPSTFGTSANEFVGCEAGTTQSGGVKTVPVTVYSFAGPRVGNDAFRDRVEDLGIRVLRVVNVHDKVTAVPGVVLNERLGFLEDQMLYFWRFLDKTLPWAYHHIGVPLFIDNLVSPFLKKTKDPLSAHNLEGYLHILNGFHGKDRPFEPSMDRDIALVNKASNFLHRRHSIPSSWWQEENKGLIRTKTGRWIVRVREPEDVPEFSMKHNPRSRV